nr:hyp [Cotesia vestalis bracovirus]
MMSLLSFNTTGTHCILMTMPIN